jgi:hypothetical protein
MGEGRSMGENSGSTCFGGELADSTGRLCEVATRFVFNANLKDVPGQPRFGKASMWSRGVRNGYSTSRRIVAKMLAKITERCHRTQITYEVKDSGWGIKSGSAKQNQRTEYQMHREMSKPAYIHENAISVVCFAILTEITMLVLKSKVSRTVAQADCAVKEHFGSELHTRKTFN